MPALPKLSMGYLCSGFSSDLLRRLCDWNKNKHDSEFPGADEVALFRDLLEATGTDLDMLPKCNIPPEAIARSVLTWCWTLLSGTMDIQELIRDIDLEERLAARSMRGDYIADIHQAEDTALAEQLRAAHYGFLWEPRKSDETREASDQIYLDYVHKFSQQNPLDLLSRVMESMSNESQKMTGMIENINSMFPSASSIIGAHHQKTFSEVSNAFLEGKLLIDQMQHGLSDTIKAAKSMSNIDIEGMNALFRETNPTKRMQAAKSVLNPLISSLEEMRAATTPGCSLGDVARDIRESIDKMPQKRDANASADSSAAMQMLQYAMRKEFFPNSHVSSDLLYWDLASTSSIRLLEHCGMSPEGYLCFDLVECDLTSPPPFAALSYVWGDPRPPLYRQMPSLPPRTRQIVCNDLKVMISANLDDALRTIFSEWQQDTDPMGCFDNRRIWIDQVCINQEDILEKNQQVACMDSIYQAATRVIAWVGPDNRHATKAVDVIGKLQNIPRKTYTAFGYDVSVKLQKFSESDLLGLCSLFTSAYFQRVWIVQELVFAKEIWMLWGRIRIDFGDLMRVSSFLVETGAWSLLAVHAATYSEGAALDGIHQSTLPRGIQTQSMIRKHVNHGQSPFTPMEIPMMARELQATDPRDRFYAMLGLAKYAAARLNVGLILPVADYERSLEDVTKDFARNYVEQTGDANILTKIEDISYRTIKSLPSWVPDFSVPLLPHPFNDACSRQWNAGGTDTRPRINNGHLLVKSRRLAKIRDTALPFNNIEDAEDWRSLLRLVLDLHEKCTDMRLPPDEQVIRVLTCTIADSLDEDIKHQFSDWMAHAISSSRENSVNTQASNAYFLQSTQSFDDSLTLVTPEDEFQRFNDMVTFRAQTYGTGWIRKIATHRVEAHNTPEARAQIEAETKSLLESLGQKNPDSLFPSPADLRRVSMSLLAAAADAPTQRDEIEQNTQKFRISTALNIQSRVLFATEDGYLGLGPQSAQIGDEVWVLSSCKVPVVLRRDEDQDAYRVVGQCFVPHAMLGQFAVGGEDAGLCEEITLV